MAEPLEVLLLGGTSEARAAAGRLAADPGIAVTLSLAGRTASPPAPDGPVALRVGGFGGADGLAAALVAEGYDLVVDATHPFAATMGRNAAAAAARAGVPILRLERPAWVPEPGDRWHRVPDLAAAAAALPAGRLCFLTVGAESLAPFAARPDVPFLVRSIEAPTVRLANARHVRARGPFEEAAERAFMAENGVERLVTKNAGGAATAAKLAAARALGVPVVMVERPPRPPADVADVEALVARVAALAGGACADHG